MAIIKARVKEEKKTLNIALSEADDALLKDYAKSKGWSAGPAASELLSTILRRETARDTEYLEWAQAKAPASGKHAKGASQG